MIHLIYRCDYDRDKAEKLGWHAFDKKVLGYAKTEEEAKAVCEKLGRDFGEEVVDILGNRYRKFWAKPVLPIE